MRALRSDSDRFRFGSLPGADDPYFLGDTYFCSRLDWFLITESWAWLLIVGTNEWFEMKKQFLSLCNSLWVLSQRTTHCAYSERKEKDPNLFPNSISFHISLSIHLISFWLQFSWPLKCFHFSRLRAFHWSLGLTVHPTDTATLGLKGHMSFLEKLITIPVTLPNHLKHIVDQTAAISCNFYSRYCPDQDRWAHNCDYSGWKCHSCQCSSQAFRWDARF
jgi:hypothetical protein